MSGVFERIADRQQRFSTRLGLGLDPREEAAEVPALVCWAEDLMSACAPYICCIKPNVAFWQAGGLAGLEALETVIGRARTLDLPVVLDVKAGDIGPTAAAYARTYFEHWGVDAVTLSPWMGTDTLTPFLEDASRGVFLLARTSNPSGAEFQTLQADGQPLYVHVVRRFADTPRQVGFVAGATCPEELARIRAEAPESWLLIPGLGAQGGAAAEVAAAAKDRYIAPVSRGIAAAADPAAAARNFRDALNQAHNKGETL